MICDTHVHTEFSCDSDAGMKKYNKESGGKYVTIGSDAHAEEDLGAGIDYAHKLMQEIGLEQVVFRKRRMEAV